MLPKSRRHHQSSHRHIGKKKKKLLLFAVIVYVIIFVAILLIPRLFDKQPETEDLPGNGAELFDTSVTFQDGSTMYRYRAEDLDTVLLIGIDKEGLDPGEKLTARSGTQADFLLLLVIDRKNRTVTPIQLDRDAMVDVDIYGVTGQPVGSRVLQICLAQGFGKSLEANCLNTASAVSRTFLGMPVDHWAVYDLTAVSVLNDLLGGVTVTVEDDLSELDEALIPGAVIRLSGDQAAKFVHARMYVGDGTNVSRLRRQRAYMQSALENVQSLAGKNGNFVKELLSGMNRCFYSDMQSGAMINLINRTLQYEVRPFLITEGEHIISNDGFMECHLDQESVNKMILDVCFKKQ